ncbi:MAG: hypothetical protein Q8R53_03120 [Nanoarchaeota archaeon]|nr:hypothetical protein [Nanoarchaeota archaeon]
MKSYEPIMVEELVQRAFAHYEKQGENYEAFVEINGVLCRNHSRYFLQIPPSIIAEALTEKPLVPPREEIMLFWSKKRVEKLLEGFFEKRLPCLLRGRYRIQKVGVFRGVPQADGRVLIGGAHTPWQEIDVHKVLSYDNNVQGRLSLADTCREGALSVIDEGKLTLVKGEDDYDE